MKASARPTSSAPSTLRRAALRLAPFAALLALAACSSDPAREEPAAGGASAEAAASRRPDGLVLQAFQVGDRVLVLARGENPTGAFDTRFVPAPGADLELRNLPPSNPAVQMITRLELAGWLPADGSPAEVRVLVAGTVERVPVRRATRVQ